MTVRRPVIALVWALVLLLAGCATIPTSGPVVSGSGPSHAPEVSVEIAPEAPHEGASPGTIVNGFLQAMANYQQGYEVARLYLAPDVRDSWRPEEGVTVYADGFGVASTPDSAVLDAPVVGRIGSDGAYEHVDGRMRLDFGLIKDADGQWRIGQPPKGIVVSQYLFGRFYQRLNTYYYDPAFTRLVPDPVFLPKGAQTATTLLQALLRGPSAWIRPAVVSAIPAQTKLNVQSASIDPRGVVEVSLSQHVAALGEDQRSRAAAQIVWTLTQIDGVTGVRLTVDGAPWAVKEQLQGVVPIGAYAWLESMPSQRVPQLYGATGAGVVRVDERSGAPVQLTPIAGEFAKRPGISAIAVSPAADRLAVVTDGGSKLWEVPIGEGQPKAVGAERTALLRPQWVGGSIPELWSMGRQDGRQLMQITREGRSVTVEAPAFAGVEVTAFRLAPDGVRLAAVIKRGGRVEVGLARVNRAGTEPVVEGWQELKLGDGTQPGPAQPLDVGWVDTTTLMVLAAEEAGRPARPFRVDQSAFAVAAIGQPDNWGAGELATAPRVGTARAVVCGPRGAWRYDEDYRWPALTHELVHAAYA